MNEPYCRCPGCGECSARTVHEVNQMLLETMQTIMNISLMDKGYWAKTIETEAHNAITKATGESK